MIILPKKLKDMKDKSEVFFVNLFILHFMTGDVYLAALDVDVDWYVPNTETKAKYLAVPIQVGEVSKYADDTVDNVELTISDVGENFSNMLFNATDFRGTMVDIIQIAYPDSLTDSTAFKPLFYGYMDEPVFSESAGTFKTTLCAIVPNVENHRTLGLTCTSWFGDPEECGATFTTVNGKTSSDTTKKIIKSDSLKGYAESYFVNGVIVVGWEARRIIASSDGQVTCEYPFFTDYIAGVEFSATNGCDGSISDCKRHNNAKNYGGFLSIPSELVIRNF